MGGKFYALKVSLMECHVEVTRTFVVPSDLRLDHLHQIIQGVMGWRDSHLHEFQTETKRYGMKIEDADEELCDERRVRLSGIAKPSKPCFGYIYDFGDYWVHRVEVIDFDYAGLPPRRKLYCLEAKGACPPEDVGGTPGYEDFCREINDSDDPEHEDMTAWVYEVCGYPRTQKWPDMVAMDWIDESLKACEAGLRRVAAAKKPKPRKVWMYTGGRK